MLFFNPKSKYTSSPTSIQVSALSCVKRSREIIISEQTPIPRIGTNGTNGVLIGRTALGSLLRRIQIPAQTKTNASKVPIEVRSPAMLPGINPPKIPTNKKSMRLDLYGVRNLGCRCENTFGRSPSCDMEKNTRLCPISITSITEENPPRIATVTAVASQLY